MMLRRIMLRRRMTRMIMLRKMRWMVMMLRTEDEVEDDDVEDDDVKGEEDDDVAVEEEENDDVEEEDRSQDREAHFVRACAIEMRINMSQEPLYTENHRKNAVPHNRDPHFVRACEVETHVKICAQNTPRTQTNTFCEPAQSKRMSRFHKSHFIQKFTGKMPQTRWSTLIKHQPLLLP